MTSTLRYQEPFRTRTNMGQQQATLDTTQCHSCKVQQENAMCPVLGGDLKTAHLKL